MRKKGMPSYKFGNKIKFKEEEVDRWVKEQNK
jgi:excisionase family DNA binding protein